MSEQDELAPLPPQSVLDVHRPTGVKLYGYTADDMRAFRAAGVAAAVERCAVLCESTGELAADMYGDGAECLQTASMCAEAIRATK
jgi:hypothetical protein